MIKLLYGIASGAFIAGLLLASGVDYPPAPDGISWANLWLAIISMGIAVVSSIAAERLEKKRRYIKKRVIHRYKEVA